ncbi:siderophore ABC transporter substrate-binding protein [Pararhodobacter zhoushanensis]|uniref:Siderophore ABC transporter substrate-binding protein n=1 Tax=Pararhodobacter zhoushanensis TaxID=2479545 RepID=A0ABT3H5G9_9RHOB|nr:siderophore ABC transporter substrate-binding protein [Pararhodobacter zhoushanensis]MCW1935047.1 siderophore ABC transporter substrate-binding protein [Pararhodobacter zhoushanensis]
MLRILTLATVALTGSAALAQTVTVQTAGGPVEVATNPDRVVALDLAAIDTLHALGVSLDGVPDFTPPAYLRAAMADVPTVGTLFEPDFEALASMAPDLIIAGGRSQARVAPLSRVAPTLDMTITGADVLTQAQDRLAAYGALFSHEAQAASLAEALSADLDTARAAVAGKGAALILMTNGGTVSAYGDDSRFGWIHTATGLPEAYPAITAENHGEAVSFEFIAEVNPDWLLVIDRGAAIGQAGEAAAATLDNPLVMGTTAGQRGQIVYLDSAALYLAAGGVQATRLILNQLTDAFTAAGD